MLDRSTRKTKLLLGKLVLAIVFAPLPLAAQISSIDIPFAAFYDHQGTYAATIGVGTFAAKTLNDASPPTLNTPKSTRKPLPESLLGFQYSPQITTRVRNQVAEKFAAQSPDQAAKIRREFEQADIVGEFRRLIKRYGYNPDNLAHNMAAFLILQWEVLTETQTQPPQMKGVAEQVAKALLSGSLLQNMNDADKQIIADSVAYQALMSELVFRDLKRRGDSAGVAQLRRGIINSARSFGWHFDRLELSTTGFVAKR